MITDRQFRKLKIDLGTGMTLVTAAVRAGMTEKTARKYRNMTKPPSESKTEHDWRTRVDPFENVWEDVKKQLEQTPSLQAKTIFQWLQREHPGQFQQGQLRTLQRRIKRWRATDGPAREVYFDQVHHPGDLCASDFTRMGSLGITIAGKRFDHMFYHFVLTYSNWESVSLCYSESFQSLSQGFQDAITRLGFIPIRHRTDRLSAAVNNLSETHDFTARYQGLMDHYDMAMEKIQPRCANENGDVESSHRHFKSAIEQALLLRGSNDFANIDDYTKFVQQHVDFRNAARSQRLAEEHQVMRELDIRRLDSFTKLTVRVNRGSLIRVQGNAYSVHSRLIGEQVQVRIFADTLEVWYAQSKVDSFPRLRGRGKHQVNYRHVIDWLVRKPGALADYRYRDDLFPTSRFRMAFDALSVAHAPRVAATKYLEILQMAARQNETAVDNALAKWLDSDQPLTPEHVLKDVMDASSLPAPREVQIDAVDLSSFDDLFSNSFFNPNQEDHDDKEVIEVVKTYIDGIEQVEAEIPTESKKRIDVGTECGPASGDAAEGTSAADVPRALPGRCATSDSGVAQLRAVPVGVGESGMSDAPSESDRHAATPIATSDGKGSSQFRSQATVGEAGSPSPRLA